MCGVKKLINSATQKIGNPTFEKSYMLPNLPQIFQNIEALVLLIFQAHFRNFKRALL